MTPIPLPRAELVRRLARQHLWCVVRHDGTIIFARTTRAAARHDVAARVRSSETHTIVRVELRRSIGRARRRAMRGTTPLTRAALVRRVAQQVVWCISDTATGTIVDAWPRRADALVRRAAIEAEQVGMQCALLRADLRVTGQRA